MRDSGKWNVGTAQLRGFAANLSQSPDEDDVAHYHEIIKLLEDGSGEDLLAFKVAPERLKPRVASVTMATDWGPGRTRYTTKKYVEIAYLRSQVQGLSHYVRCILVGGEGDVNGETGAGEKAYGSINDPELQELAIKRGIKPKKFPNPGEDAFGRKYLIAALIQLDRKSESTSPSVSNYVHVEHMHNSSLMQGSHGSSISQSFDLKSQEFQRFLADLREMVNGVTLDEVERSQIDADLTTAEAQVNSPKPKHSVIRECMISVRAVLENAAGSLLASGAIAAINHYFPG